MLQSFTRTSGEATLPTEETEGTMVKQGKRKHPTPFVSDKPQSDSSNTAKQRKKRKVAETIDLSTSSIADLDAPQQQSSGPTVKKEKQTSGTR